MCHMVAPGLGAVSAWSSRMSSNGRGLWWRSAGAVGVIGLAATASLGQAEKGGQPAGAPLGGPEVSPREVPGVVGKFGEMSEGQRRMAERIPPRVMREALKALNEEDAPEEIRATPEQMESFARIQREFEEDLRAYAREHREELEELRDMLPNGGPAAELLRRLDGGRGEARRPGRNADRRGPGDEMGEPMQDGERARSAREIPEEARQRLRELSEEMPQYEQAYTRIWEQLRPAQREAVEARLEVFRERMAKQREDAYVRQRVGKDGAAPKPGEDRARAPRDGARDEMREESMRGAPESDRARPAMQRRERLMRLFESMTPEQQEQLLERLEARMREAGVSPGAARGRARPDRGQPKPAPDMDRVNVPSPDEMDDAEGKKKGEPKP